MTPRSIGRQIRENGGANLLVSPTRYTTALSLGLFDQNILCEACDGFLNTRYDDPAFEFLKTFSLSPNEIVTDAYFERKGVDCDLLCGFVLSILWRHSVSTLRDTSEVNLGPFQDRAREVLWGVKRLTSFPEFQVVCQRYTKGPIETGKIYSSPVKMKDPGFNAYGFSMLGFHFLTKVDCRPLPPIFTQFVMNGSGVLRGYFVDFRDTPQGRRAREMVAAARLRRKTP